MGPEKPLFLTSYAAFYPPQKERYILREKISQNFQLIKEYQKELLRHFKFLVFSAILQSKTMPSSVFNEIDWLNYSTSCLVLGKKWSM